MEQMRIGFIGLGLIGGSLARAIRKFHPTYELFAYTHSETTAQLALEENIIDHICTEQDAAFGSCDYIFLCAPVSTNISYLPFLKSVISEKCIISDVGSVKGEIHKAVRDLALTHCFIGGHPMAGSEKTGFSNSTDYLLENAYYCLTPAEHIDVMRLAAFADLISSLGSIPLVLTYQEHDYITAGVSHLPHIIAAALVNTVQTLDTPEEYMKMIAAGGFKDITRIASSSPLVWQQICASNREMISKVLDTYIRQLVQAKCLVDTGDGGALYQLFDDAKEYRNSLPDLSAGLIQKVYSLYCDIYDETGGIAAIATLLATNNINIKNIGIIHNREFEEGVLRMEFYNDESCQKAARVLQERNYNIHRR